MKLTRFFNPFCILTLFCSFVNTAAHAQILGCDNNRYKTEVFTSTAKTTVTYGSNLDVLGQTISLKMDVYEPVGDALTQRPAIVLAHGGSFVFGNKSDMQANAELLARHGFVAVSIQYRLYPIFPLGYPDSLAIMDAAIKAFGDMKAAIRYLREDAATANVYKIDPNNIFVGGYSAGAVAAMHVAQMDDTDPIPAFAQSAIDANGGINGSTGSASNQTYSSAVKAVLNMSGGLYKSAFVNAGAPPITSIHGTADDVVPFNFGLAAGIMSLEGSERVHQEANAVGIYNYLEVVTGGDHVNMYAAGSTFAPNVASFFQHGTEMLYNCVCGASSTEEASEGKPGVLAVSPNPAVDRILLDLRAIGFEKADIALYDLTGKCVMTQLQAVDQQPIDISRLPAGAYWIQVNGGKAIGRFVKN